jgi:hypothetical protein
MEPTSGFFIEKKLTTIYQFWFVETPRTVNVLFANNKFTWCFHKPKLIDIIIRHAKELIYSFTVVM